MKRHCSTAVKAGIISKKGVTETEEKGEGGNSKHIRRKSVKRVHLPLEKRNRN